MVLYFPILQKFINPMKSKKLIELQQDKFKQIHGQMHGSKITTNYEQRPEKKARDYKWRVNYLNDNRFLIRNNGRLNAM
jgi:hypothetical protein